MWSRPSGPAKVLRHIQSQDSFKLKGLGMDGTALFWMDSYLEGSSRLRMVGSCWRPCQSPMGDLFVSREQTFTTPGQDRNYFVWFKAQVK